jgi:hypothetical protein
MPVVIIMDNETENEDSEENEKCLENIIEKHKENRLLARRNEYGENT